MNFFKHAFMLAFAALISVVEVDAAAGLDKINAYIDAGHSLDAIRDAGWGSWIDRLEEKGVDLGTGE